jgi:hypothetical protein
MMATAASLEVFRLPLSRRLFGCEKPFTPTSTPTLKLLVQKGYEIKRTWFLAFMILSKG